MTDKEIYDSIYGLMYENNFSIFDLEESYKNNRETIDNLKNIFQLKNIKDARLILAAVNLFSEDYEKSKEYLCKDNEIFCDLIPEREDVLLILSACERDKQFFSMVWNYTFIVENRAGILTCNNENNNIISFDWNSAVTYGIEKHISYLAAATDSWLPFGNENGYELPNNMGKLLIKYSEMDLFLVFNARLYQDFIERKFKLSIFFRDGEGKEFSQTQDHILGDKVVFKFSNIDAKKGINDLSLKYEPIDK